MVLPFTPEERAYLSSADIEARLRQSLPPKYIAVISKGLHGDMFNKDVLYDEIDREVKTKAGWRDVLYAIAIASDISDPEARLLSIASALTIPWQRYPKDMDARYRMLRWLRDPETAPRFGPRYREAYIRDNEPPYLTALVKTQSNGLDFSCDRPFDPEMYPSSIDLNRTRYFDANHIGTIKEIISILVLKTISGTIVPKVHSTPDAMGSTASLNGTTSSNNTIPNGGPPFSIIGRIGELFLSMCRIADVPVIDLTIRIEDGFPLFDFSIDGLPFSTLPGGYIGGPYSDIEFLVRATDLEAQMHGTVYPETRSFDVTMTAHQLKMDVEGILWWLINSPVCRYARFRELQRHRDSPFDSRCIDNLPELVYRAGLTSSPDRDSSALREHLASSRSLVFPKGKQVRRRIREWLDANPSIPRRTQPKELPDRPEYCLYPESIAALPEDLHPWFESKTWFVSDPYAAIGALLSHLDIELIYSYRREELHRFTLEKGMFTVGSLRERLALLDREGERNEWTDLSRYCLEDFAELERDLINAFHNADNGDGDGDDIITAKRNYYFATRGFRAEEYGQSIQLLEIYSGNRSEEEVKELLERADGVSMAACEAIRYPYPWRANRNTLTRYFKEGYVEPSTPEIEAESVRYRFFRTMTSEQHRHASALYRDDPETPMSGREYITMLPSNISPLDPIALDLSSQEVFDETVRRLGVVFPLGFDADYEERYNYLINGLFTYRTVLKRDSNFDYTRSSLDLDVNRSFTDAEIIARLNCYPIWSSTFELRIATSSFARGEVSFFVPIDPKCVNVRTSVGLEEVSELASSGRRFILAYGSPLSGSVSSPAAGSSIPNYLCHTFYDLAAGFRPAGVHNDILRYAVFDVEGRYQEVGEESVAQLIRFTQKILHLLNEQDRTDAQEMLRNIAYLKRQLVKRTERDIASKSGFDSLPYDQDREAARNYLSLLFEYGMYLRRWKGPGHAYPMAEVETLCTTFDMNRDLIAPTGRLQEAHRALSPSAKGFVDSLPMKHYILGAYSESSSMNIADLIYQLNRQDDDNMCIRMGSTKVIGSAVYYLDLLFGVVIEGFEIEELDHIQ